MIHSFKYLSVPVQAKTTLSIVVDREGRAVGALSFSNDKEVEKLGEKHNKGLLYGKNVLLKKPRLCRGRHTPL